MFVLQFTKTTMLSFEDVRVVDADVLEVCIEASAVLLAEVLRGLDGVVDQLLVVSIVKRSRNNVCKRLCGTVYFSLPYTATWAQLERSAAAKPHPAFSREW